MSDTLALLVDLRTHLMVFEPVFVLRGLPDSKSNLLTFIQEVHGHYLHQRPLHTPVVVHCR